MFKKLFILTFFIWFNLNAQIVINKPNLGFTQACASASFNNYNLNFTFFPPANLLPGNQFIVELSDSNGGFSTPTTLKTLTSITSPVNTSVSFPNNVYGENYTIRIRSTAPAATSPVSNFFPAYYAVFNQFFTINNNQSTVRVCNGQASTLSIDAGPNSPLQYPQLKYRWYKNNIIIPGENKSTLSVSQTGNYYAEVDYGSCSYTDAHSNQVSVDSSVLTPTIQTSDQSNFLCEGTPKIINCSVQNSNYTYKWYRNAALISGANTFTYNATQPGTYKVIVTDGSCDFNSNDLTLISNPVSIKITQPSTNLIIPGQTITLNTTTDALSPSYTWYLNGVLLPGQTSSTLTVSKNGNYKVIVLQNQGCAAQQSDEITIVYPTGFDLGIQNSSAYTQCQSTSATLVINKFNALTPSGPVNIIGNNYNYTYQWYKNGAIVSGATGITLNLNNSQANGSYKLGTTIPDFGEIFSNTIDVQLKITEDITISNNIPLCQNGDSVILQSKLTNPNYTYDWYFNGNKVATNTTGTYTVTQSGSYYLIVKSGTCSLQSNTLNLQASTFNLSLTSPSLTIVPGQQINLTVNTDAIQPTYSWYKDGALLSGQITSTLSITKNGLYKVVVNQTQGCTVSKNAEITISYPTGFDLGIQNSSAYTQCQSTSATLAINKFNALTPSGPINILGNTYNYSYQWYKNGVAVSGATGITLNLNNSQANGLYKLGTTIPDFGEIFSNTIDVQLKITEDITISNTTPLCQNGDSVILQSKLTNPNYTYDWYFNGNKVATNTTGSYTVTQTGNYYLIVKSGTCSLQSNTLNLQASNFNLSLAAPSTVIMPGQQFNLTANTDAIQPTYLWYKDGVLITGQTTNVLSITKPGLYKVVVNQTQGCVINKNAEITISYPTGFDVGIQNTLAYTQCQSTNATLAINKFNALTPSGPINILENNFNYVYQWYKDGNLISGATNPNLNISGSLSNGVYKLGVTIPDFGLIFSNTIDVQLKISEDITISANNTFCKDGDTVILQSKLTNPNYTYEWYFNGSKVATNTTGSYTVSQSGSYYLIVKSGNCSLQSNTIILQASNFNLNLTSSASILIPEEQLALTATNDAQQPTYIWYKDGELISGENSNTLTVSKNGIYKVSVTQNQGCIVVKSADINIQYPTGFEIGIKNTLSYTQCQNTSASLAIDKFNALTPSGPVSILNNNYNFNYQWYKDDVAILGATTKIFDLNNALQNGVYKLGVTIPEFGEIFSNTVDVQLKITEDITITSSGSFCKNGDVVILQSKLTDPNYTYEWYFNGNKVSSDVGSYTVSEDGSYYLIVKSGSCSLKSNEITLQEAIFSVYISSTAPFIIPGQTMTLTTYTDADQPGYVWYKDGNVVDGVNSNNLQITEPGNYKVEVTQTQGCQVVKTAEVTIGYPSGFTVVIAPASGYQDCKNLSTNLKVVKIIANSPSGNVDLTNNPYGYTFQWYKDDFVINAATENTYSVTDFTQNGDYKLQVIIPDFPNTFSNSLKILLSLSQPVTITQEGVFCDEGTEVVLTSNYTDPLFDYEWFESSSDDVLGIQEEIVINQSGNYYLKVSQYGCSLNSNVITVKPYDFAEVYIDAPEKFSITEGEYRIITATGADSYEWYFNNQLISTSNSYKVTEAGIYTLIVKVGECENIYTFEVTYHEKKFIVSNTVTPNGDGFNDYWSIPLNYAYKQDVLVTIFDAEGKIVLRTTAYENNWPESNFQFSQKSPVFYFSVEKVSGESLKVGSITIIK